MSNPYNIELDTGQSVLNQKTREKMILTVTQLLVYLSSRIDITPRNIKDMITVLNGLISESPYEFTFEEDGKYLSTRDYYDGVVIRIPYSAWVNITNRKKIEEYYNAKKPI